MSSHLVYNGSHCQYFGGETEDPGAEIIYFGNIFVSNDPPSLNVPKGIPTKLDARQFKSRRFRA